MARELHTLNETEMGMVNEYVESGIADTHEEALKYLLESGMIQDRVGGKGVYIPEGYAHLKFHNGHQKSMFSIIDKLSKKAKVDSPFELENWYLGADADKNEDGTFILESVKKGYELGMNPEIIVTHIMYSGNKFNPSKPKEAVGTTLSNSMNIEHQKQMIDLKSKKSLYTLRQEQLKQFNVEKYSDIEPLEKIKFTINVFCLVKTEDGWKKAWIENTVGKPEFRLESDFLEEVTKVRKTPMFNFITTLETNEDPTNAGSYIRKLNIKEALPTEIRAEILPLVGECNRAISKFLSDQRDLVMNSNSTPEQAIQEDSLEEDEIEWDK